MVAGAVSLVRNIIVNSLISVKSAVLQENNMKKLWVFFFGSYGSWGWFADNIPGLKNFLRNRIIRKKR